MYFDDSGTTLPFRSSNSTKRWSVDGSLLLQQAVDVGFSSDRVIQGCDLASVPAKRGSE